MSFYSSLTVLVSGFKSKDISPPGDHECNSKKNHKLSSFVISLFLFYLLSFFLEREKMKKGNTFLLIF